MTTVINSPGTGEGSATGVIVGVLVAIVLIALFFIYGLPAIRGNQGADNGKLDVNVTLPAPSPSPSGSNY